MTDASGTKLKPKGRRTDRKWRIVRADGTATKWKKGNWKK